MYGLDALDIITAAAASIGVGFGLLVKAQLESERALHNGLKGRVRDYFWAQKQYRAGDWQREAAEQRLKLGAGVDLFE